MGLVKTRQVIVDTTSQPKDIAYPTDADLLYRARKKIVKVVERVRGEVAPFGNPFEPSPGSEENAHHRQEVLPPAKPGARKEGVEKPKAMTSSVVKQAEKLVKSPMAGEERILPDP